MKRIKEKIILWLLGNQLDQLWSTQAGQDQRLADLENKEKDRTERTIQLEKDIHKVAKYLGAITEHLNVKVTHELVPDPSCDIPKPKMMEVVKLVKT